MSPAAQRQYHDVADARYVLPNDSPEHERLTGQAHHLSVMMKRRITHAPIDAAQVSSGLDVGCGTGVATRYMAQEYPQATWYGLDLSKVPEEERRPANVKFLKGDVLSQRPEQWLDDAQQPFNGGNEAAFDFIFSRLLVMGMSDWPLYFKQALPLLKPGGWIEIQDLDCVYYDMNHKRIGADMFWYNKLIAACSDRGLDVHCGSKAKDWLAEAGFENIQVIPYEYPFGSNQQPAGEVREFAKFNEVNLPLLLSAAYRHMMQGKAEPAEIDEVVEDMARFFSTENAVYMPFVVTTARKPL